MDDLRVGHEDEGGRVSEGFCDVDLSDVSEDADVVAFFHKTTPKARKPYKCIECRDTIEVGQVHEKNVYRFDGTFCSERRCMACVEVAGEFEYTVFGGGLWMHMQEQWEEGAHVQACIQRLSTVAAKTLMQRRYLKWKGLA